MALIVFIDMDDVICDYTSAYHRALESDPDINFPQSVPGFFECLRPIDGAVEGVNSLRDCFEVYILSAPRLETPLSYTEKRLWVERHFDYSFTKRLILSPNKGLLKGDVLIDDHREGRGQEGFTGELIHFGTPQFPSWIEVLRHLRTRE